MDDLEGKPAKALLKRPRVWVYSTILLAALAGIIYGLGSLAAIDLKVLHERAPLFVTLSDGSIQNKYTLKMLNKMPEDLSVRISASGPEGLRLVGAEEPIQIHNGGVTPAMVFVKVPKKNLEHDDDDRDDDDEDRHPGHRMPNEQQEPIRFRVEAVRGNGQVVKAERDSVFIGPGR